MLAITPEAVATMATYPLQVAQTLLRTQPNAQGEARRDGYLR